jgi:hypothetical protein
MAYDAGHGRVVLFGGYTGTGVSSDTWVWDGTDWTNVTPSNPASSPSAREGAAMAYDAAHGQVVLFSGNNGSSYTSDTWVWDGANWTNVTPASPAPSPPARNADAMAYDARHGQVVLFGGNSGGILAYGDTWAWTHGIFATAGNPQSTPAGTAFSFPLQVTVIDNTGTYVQGAQVTFASVPTGMVSFSSSVATTDSTGRASVTAAATATAGSYIVTATLASGDFAEFSLSNVNPSGSTGACQVTTALDDNSAGSLRSQVAACGMGGTITFASGLARVVVSQEQDIQLTQNLTVNGGTGVTVDADSSSRIFFVNGGNLLLENLTLQNGLAKGGDGENASTAAGGGGGGFGGAIFVNAGNLSLTGVALSSNQALGGSGGSIVEFAPALVGGGGGMGGDSLGEGAGSGNGGGGGDLGGSGGGGSSGGPGGGAGGGENGGGGFGGGGGGGHIGGGFGGFGGGGGGGQAGGGFGGSFGGDGVGGGNVSGGGGAGLGGAIFVNTGALTLQNASFADNSADGGAGGTGFSNGANGQGKGGALFINSGATAFYSGTAPSFSGDSASDAGIHTACSSVVGAGALDTNDVCGILNALVATTTTASNAVATFSASSQNVTLSATVTSGAGTVNGGTITFTLSGVAGSATSGTVSGGSASAMFLLPANTPVGVYTITATYSGSGNFASSVDTTHTLAVVLNVSGQVSVTETGFAVNHATGLWTSTLRVQNTSAAPIGGPIEVVLTNLSANATMMNETGAVGGGVPYIVVSAGTLAAGASASVAIQFKNSTNGSISFTPVTYSGAF